MTRRSLPSQTFELAAGWKLGQSFRSSGTEAFENVFFLVTAPDLIKKPFIARKVFVTEVAL